MDLALPWRLPGLETNEKLPYGASWNLMEPHEAKKLKNLRKLTKTQKKINYHQTQLLSNQNKAFLTKIRP